MSTGDVIFCQILGPGDLAAKLVGKERRRRDYNNPWYDRTPSPYPPMRGFREPMMEVFPGPGRLPGGHHRGLDNYYPPLIREGAGRATRHHGITPEEVHHWMACRDSVSAHGMGLNGRHPSYRPSNVDDWSLKEVKLFLDENFERITDCMKRLGVPHPYQNLVKMSPERKLQIIKWYLGDQGYGQRHHAHGHHHRALDDRAWHGSPRGRSSRRDYDDYSDELPRHHGHHRHHARPSSPLSILGSNPVDDYHRGHDYGYDYSDDISWDYNTPRGY